MLEKTLESPLDCKEIKLVNPKGNQPWKQEEKGMRGNEMVGWHHRLNGFEFDQTPRDDEGQGRLVCCSPWGRTDSDMTEQLKNNSLYIYTHTHTHTQGGERFTMRIGSYRYGGWEAPQAALSKLEIPESWGCNWSQVQRPRNQWSQL